MTNPNIQFMVVVKSYWGKKIKNKSESSNLKAAGKSSGKVKVNINKQKGICQLIKSRTKLLKRKWYLSLNTNMYKNGWNTMAPILTQVHRDWRGQQVNVQHKLLNPGLEVKTKTEILPSRTCKGSVNTRNLECHKATKASSWQCDQSHSVSIHINFIYIVPNYIKCHRKAPAD